jgi:hypothetical protein
MLPPIAILHHGRESWLAGLALPLPDSSLDSVRASRLAEVGRGEHAKQHQSGLGLEWNACLNSDRVQRVA